MNIDNLKFALSEINAGGSDLIFGDEYELVGEADADYTVSLSQVCGQAADHIALLEKYNPPKFTRKEIKILLIALDEYEGGELTPMSHDALCPPIEDKLEALYFESTKQDQNQ